MSCFFPTWRKGDQVAEVDVLGLIWMSKYLLNNTEADGIGFKINAMGEQSNSYSGILRVFLPCQGYFPEAISYLLCFYYVSKQKSIFFFKLGSRFYLS